MRVARNTLIKNFPPKLRELAIQRAKGEGVNGIEVLEKSVDCAFTWAETPEGIIFWSKVANGQEFEWTEVEEIKGRFNKGDIIVHPTQGKGYYVTKGFIEYITEGRGWGRHNGVIPANYISIATNRYWSIDEKEWTKEEKIEEKRKSFKIGDYIENDTSGQHHGRWVGKGERGVVTRVEDGGIYFIADKDGEETSRRETFLTNLSDVGIKPPVKEQLVKGGMGIYEALKEHGVTYKWEIPEHYFHTWGHSKSPWELDKEEERGGVMEMPEAIIIKKKRREKRIL